MLFNCISPCSRLSSLCRLEIVSIYHCYCNLKSKRPNGKSILKIQAQQEIKYHACTKAELISVPNQQLYLLL